MGTTSSQHCDKYDFLYALPKENSTYSNLNEYVLKAPLKSRSSSSLYILNVINNFKGFSASKSFFNDLKLLKQPSRGRSKKQDLHHNSYMPLTPRQHQGIFSKSLSLNNFGPDKQMTEAERKAMCREEVEEWRRDSRRMKKEGGLLQSTHAHKRMSQLQVQFSRLGSNLTYDNQAYTAEKALQSTNYNSNNSSNNKNNYTDKNNNYNKGLCPMDRLNNNFVLLQPPAPPPPPPPPSSTKARCSKQVHHRLQEEACKSLQASEVCCKQVLMQATTPELLLCLGGFLTQRFKHLQDFDCSKAISWMRNVDRSLLLQGWQDVVFISPANIVFVYLLINSEGSRQRVNSVQGLQLLVLTCLYVSYTYMGNEISYPSKPFLLDHVSKEAFWDRCLQIIHSNSSDMLKINKDPSFFADNFSELKSYFKN